MLAATLTGPRRPGTVVGMKRRNWKVWVAGIALAQLLIVEVDAALLIPSPQSKAEQAASQITIGMVVGKRFALPGASWGGGFGTMQLWHERYSFNDGSILWVGVNSEDAITSVTVSRAEPIHPLTRLRRALARVFPFLGE
jgi:hypothetical protein